VAYSKTSWVDRMVQYPNRFTKSSETPTQVTLAADPGVVTNAGTPISASNLNKIEQGLYDAHIAADAALVARNLYAYKNMGGSL
jgi:hypothetical protein